MIVELSRQHPLRQRLLQLVEQTVLCKQLLRVTTSQKLIQSCFVDCHIDGPFDSIHMTLRSRLRIGRTRMRPGKIGFTNTISDGR